MKNISTHFLQVSTVLGAFALAVAFMFGVQSTPEVNAATCTVDFSTTGAASDADTTCRVDVGGSLTVTVKTDQIEKVQMFNDDAGTGAVSLATVSAGGTAYTAATTTCTGTAAPAGGVTATYGTVTVSGGNVITAVAVVNPGSGYASAPTLTCVDSDGGDEGGTVTIVGTLRTDAKLLAESGAGIATHTDALSLVIDSDTTATAAGENGPQKQTTLSASNVYSTTFTVAAGTTPGFALMGVDEFGSTADTFALTDAAGVSDAAKRLNVFYVDVLGKPVDALDATDDDGDGVADACLESANACSTNTASTPDATAGTSSVVVDVKDTSGIRLGGLTTLTATGYTFDQSGTDTLVFNASLTASDTYTLKGLATGSTNVKATITAAYSGTTGSRTYTFYSTRSDSAVSTVTAVLYKDASEASTSLAADAAVAAGAELMPQDTNAVDTDGAKDDEYYIDVNVMDSAGNMVTGKTLTWTDDDGLTSKGLGVAGAGGITTAVYDGDTTGDAHVTTDVDDGAGGDASSDGDIKIGVGHLASGIYNITFKESVSLNTATLTLNVRGAGSAFELTGPANILSGEIGIYTVTALDANGFATSASTAATFIVTGLGTGAGAGSKVPTDGNVSISSSTGANITVVAPTTGGSGTVALIHGGKVQQSIAVSYGAAVATVSGAGCTGTATGNYTCVVTGGGTAAEVATAAGAVSIWQSDSLGVLQGYVVGTPDFVNTGIASTGAIASDSAIIVVR